MSEKIDNIVVYKNKIKKEILDISKEDLEAYKSIEWENVFEFWNAHKDEKVLPILVEIRNILNYSALTHPITWEEHQALLDLEKAKKNDEQEAKRAEEKAAWDALTPEEKNFILKTRFVNKLFMGIVVFVLVGLSLLILKSEITTYPYPKDGCPSKHYWDEKGTIFSWKGSCKPYYNH